MKGVTQLTWRRLPRARHQLGQARLKAASPRCGGEVAQPARLALVLALEVQDRRILVALRAQHLVRKVQRIRPIHGIVDLVDRRLTLGHRWRLQVAGGREM